MYHTQLKRLQREEIILQSLKRLDYLTRSQLQVIHGLSSERNAQRVLKQLEDRVHIIRNGEYIYYLNKKGREAVGCEKVRKGTGNVQHFIMRNTIFVAMGMPATWRNEIRIKNGSTKANTVVNVCDAHFTRDNVHYIVEVDNTQTMKKNSAKINRYRILLERGAFGKKAPVFIWITTTELRRKQLAKLCDGLQVQVFTVGDFN